MHCDGPGLYRPAWELAGSCRCSCLSQPVTQMLRHGLHMRHVSMHPNPQAEGSGKPSQWPSSHGMNALHVDCAFAKLRTHAINLDPAAAQPSHPDST